MDWASAKPSTVRSRFLHCHA